MFQIPSRTHNHKGFTLIELLIVILIVGIVYALGFSRIEIGKQKPQALTPLNLKATIIKSEWFNGHATLLCINKCKTCYIRREIGTPFQSYSNAIDLSGITAYTIDNNENLVEIEYERYNDKKICLKMDFYDNGSATQIILQQKDKSYFLPSYFSKAKAFESPEDAKEYWLKDTHLIADNGNFY